MGHDLGDEASEQQHHNRKRYRIYSSLIARHLEIPAVQIEQANTNQ
jgi:hypothetical protein